MPGDNLKLAVLIDADNAPRDCMMSVMEEVALYGTPTIKRIYGDWTSPHMNGWKNSLLENAVTPIQQYGYTTGKNSTDSAMIIDAMDILYTGHTDGFVLVSSDSDFTRLAMRLREAGKYVIGIGESKTPSPFIVACDRFIYIEVIRERARKALLAGLSKKTGSTQSNKKTYTVKPSSNNSKKPDKPAPAAAQTEKNVPDEVVEFIADSIADLADEAGFAALSSLGNLMSKKQPDFDARNFGFAKLSTMMKSISRFEIDERPSSADSMAKIVYIKDLDA